MQAIRQSFERELKQKLQQKSGSFQSEEVVLTKAFKYFDLNNDGVCHPEEFIKAMEKLGIVGVSKDQLNQLFQSYDEDKNGYLDYKEFSSILFNRPSTSSSSPAKEGMRPPTSSRSEEILQKLRDKLHSRGARGIIGLGKQFRIMDDNNSRSLDYQEFSKATRDYGLGLSEGETKNLFATFDINRDNNVDYDEFLRMIRGPMNNFRKAIVAKAFNKLDKDGSGEVDINDIRGVYNARFHPDVKAGKRTEDEILTEFLETFEVHHNVLLGKKGDGIVTKEEFEEYYNNVSASVDTDVYFEQMMTSAWKLNEAPAYTQNKAWGNQEGSSKKVSQAYEEKKGGARGATTNGKQEPKQEQRQEASNGAVHHSGAAGDLEDRLREKLASRGARGFIGLQRQFKIMDDDNSKTIEWHEFTKALRDYGTGFNESEMKALFNAFDSDRNGSLDYDEFIRGVRGPMSSNRIAIVDQAFKKLDRSGDGIVDITDIKGVYSARMHPDVKSGKKTEDEILGEFLETFEMHHNLKIARKGDRQVSREEFIEYYNNVSASIDNDEYFKLMMTNAWKLDGPGNTQKGWASADSAAGRGTGRNKHETQAPFGTNSGAQPNEQSRPTTAKATENSRGGPAGTPSWPTYDAQKPGSRPQTAQVSQSQQHQPQAANLPPASKSDQHLLETLREKLISRGARGIFGLQRLFKIMDDDGSRDLNVPEFRKAIKDFRLPFTEAEVDRLFKVFDRDRSGSVDYEEFLRSIRGEMNAFRTSFVEKAFKILDKNGSGIVDLDDIRGVYNATFHPDVKSGKRTEDEILSEFLDTFEMHYSLAHDGARDGKIELHEFVEYYNNVSMSIDDDQYFKLMIERAWNMDNSKVSQKGWRGDN